MPREVTWQVAFMLLRVRWSRGSAKRKSASAWNFRWPGWPGRLIAHSSINLLVQNFGDKDIYTLEDANRIQNRQ